MWNLVAAETREAQVYLRLLEKIELQRTAYRGQVFDVLGEALSGTALRRLLIDAIRYGDDPRVRQRINQVIDDTVGRRVRDAIEHPPLAEEAMAFADVERISREMREAATRHLQPRDVQAFFAAAMACLGGRLVEREAGRFQVAAVPMSVRQRDREIGTGAPVLASYERVTFDKEAVRLSGTPSADLLAPGHPLLNAVIDVILERHRLLLAQGTAFIDPQNAGIVPRVLVMLEHEIADGRSNRRETHTVVSKRFEFVEINATGAATPAGYAPHLYYRMPTNGEQDRVRRLLESDWLKGDLEARANWSRHQCSHTKTPRRGSLSYGESRCCDASRGPEAPDTRDQLLEPPVRAASSQGRGRKHSTVKRRSCAAASRAAR